ncbi:thiol-disulfide isomerase/thioredoxin [Neolewinella xylanilytica]|uniref:Thiol-disulfide isomerase/thioredoxin n=1 Tax=Neolewinella xylanilytica TaxID=1514080 RepID=A0A2S6IA32_9BACT|nr:TlpA disulfide reductase family protein [Neolewinella xylanilytica]PPK88348.1 thiol-disulfide isomerase/thioredoxin [Neolewinella xylanilytica]
MFPTLKRFLNTWFFPGLVFGGLYLTGLHTPVIAFVQRGILATGLLRPETDVTLPTATTVTPPTTDHLKFRMTDSAGRTVDAHALAGKVIFLNLWASWCPPCLAELPNIAALHADYATDPDIAFVLLNVEEDVTKGTDYVERHGFDFPVYHLRGTLPESLSSGTLPTTYVIAPSGEVVVARKGMAQYDTRAFRELLERLRP